MVAVPDPTTPTSRVHTTADGDAVVLRVDGNLDLHAGAELVAKVAAAVEAGTTTLDIDLSDLEGYDEHGASALLACRDAAQSLGSSFHYRTCSGGPGQDVLLLAYADEG